MKSALAGAVACAVSAFAAASAAAQATTPLPSPTTTQFGPPTQPQPSTSSGTPTSGFSGASFNSPGVQTTQPQPVFPYNSPGAPFNAAPGGALAPPAPSSAPFFPGVIPAPGAPATETAPGSGGTPSATPMPTPIRRRASMRLLDEANAERQRALAQEFSARHADMVNSDDWHAASRSERKTKLRALKAEFHRRAAGLRDKYFRERSLLQAAQ